MEPTTSTALTASPASTPAARVSLPRPVALAAVIIAAALPVVLLVTAVLVMLSLNYNFLNWME